MFTLLVSSKTMEPKTCPFSVALTTPVFQSKAEALNTLLESKNELQLRRLMHISPKLAAATHERINNWSTAELSSAWYSFVGDVYKGLSIEEFSADDLGFAQDHMATLSGLYGLLRPLDLIAPYRLELGYKLSGRGFKNLYDYWSDSVAQQLPADETIINLSSEEYIKVIRPHVADARIITPQFLQIKNGKPEFQAVHAKTARGMMARWICTNRIDSPSKLKNFAKDRYTYSAELSTPQQPTFTREFIPVAMQRQNAI
ncbi:YaaA family protein [Candidatus Saccharibacteria bacterium]|nr:YaaA family protein [Candidatus Saccharibacteria bacterium]